MSKLQRKVILTIGIVSILFVIVFSSGILFTNRNFDCFLVKNISMLGLSSNVAEADVHVRGYYRKDGTYVRPHYRSNPDSNPYNNWTFPGNVNPYTGKVAPGNPDTYLKNYYNKDSYGSNYNYKSPSELTPLYKVSPPPNYFGDLESIPVPIRIWAAQHNIRVNYVSKQIIILSKEHRVEIFKPGQFFTMDSIAYIIPSWYKSWTSIDSKNATSGWSPSNEYHVSLPIVTYSMTKTVFKDDHKTWFIPRGNLKLISIPDGNGGWLTATIGAWSQSGMPSADGYGHLVFFFHDNKFIGWDSRYVSMMIKNIEGAGVGRFKVTYASYKPEDALCCPSLPDKVVFYRWNNSTKRFDASDPITNQQYGYGNLLEVTYLP